MKAINIKEEKIVLVELPIPQPKQGEVLIKIKASAINRADLAQRNGLYPPPPGASPIMGLECSGIIEAVGEGVKTRLVGEEVCALLAGGGYAEYVTCPEQQVTSVPKGLDWIESASIPEVYATCWLNLFMEGNLTAGNKVLFHAGASGIGTAGIQLCNNFGCESFISAGTKEKIEFCINLGASGGSIREKVFEEIQEWSPEGVDIILDPVGANYLEGNLKVLGLEGKLIIIGLMSGMQTDINLGHLMMKRQRIIGSTIRARSVELKGEVMKDLETKVWPLFSDGSIKPIIHEVFELQDVEKAHSVMERNENIGKVVLKVD
jgi:putative PIG3 family NAD(P)H quinone oxidoreductase